MNDSQEAPIPASTEPLAPRNAMMFVNTKSRRGAEWFDQARTRLLESGIQLERSCSYKAIQELEREVKAAVQREMPLVIVGGGDGTISAVSKHFVGAKSILGVLPLGTGNAFARDLGIPGDVEVACDTIATGKVAAVDVGRADGGYFLNVATIGLTTKIAQSLTVDQKRKWGRFVYAIAIAKSLMRVRPFRAKIVYDGGQEEFETLQVVVGSGHYHAGPFPLSPTASITDGKLRIYALASMNKAAFIKLALTMPLGHQGRLREVFAAEATKVVVTTTPRKAVTIDGEISGRTPIEFSIDPRSLRVVVPQDFSG